MCLSSDRTVENPDFLFRVLFRLVYLGGLDEASLFKNDTKFLNFPAANGINRHFKLDELVKSQKAPVIVIPVKTEIQENQSRRGGRLPLSDRSRGQVSRE